MAEIRIRYLSDDGLAELKQSFDRNLDKYKENDHQYFLNMLENHGYLMDSAYVIEDFTSDLVFSGDTDRDDLHNIKVIYDAMRYIPTYIMMDDRFWAGITHTFMWDYVQKRRKGEAFGENISGQRDKIYNSYFTHTKHGKKRGTYVNCVSRLWWAGKLTYDDNEQNHYILTEELCKKGFPSTIILFSSSNIMGKSEARKALLTTVRELRNIGQEVKRDDIMAAIRYLNLVAGVSLIDTMTYEEIFDIVKTFYYKLYNLQ